MGTAWGEVVSALMAGMPLRRVGPAATVLLMDTQPLYTATNQHIYEARRHVMPSNSVHYPLLWNTKLGFEGSQAKTISG